MKIYTKPVFDDNDGYGSSNEDIADYLSTAEDALSEVTEAIHSANYPLEVAEKMCEFVNKVRNDTQVIREWLENGDPSVDFEWKNIFREEGE